MEKYFDLLSNIAEQLTQQAVQWSAVAVDLERIEQLLSAAECKIEAADKAG